MPLPSFVPTNFPSWEKIVEYWRGAAVVRGAQEGTGQPAAHPGAGLRRKPRPRQAGDVPAAVVVEIELAIRIPLQHASSEKLVQVGPLKTEMPRHRRPVYEFMHAIAPAPRRSALVRRQSHRWNALSPRKHTANLWGNHGFIDLKYAEVVGWRGPRTNPRAPKNLDRSEG
jgi:hypothetical protein